MIALWFTLGWSLALPPQVAAPQAVPLPGDAALAARVQGHFQQHCARCHGVELEKQGKKPKDGFGFVDDLARLARDRDYVVAGAPDRSPLYGALLPDADPRMPFGADKDPTKALAPDAIRDVADWIRSLTADPAPARGDGPFVRDAELVQAMGQDLARRASPKQRELTRYVTLTHLYNQGATESELELARQAVTKLLNSLSWESSLVVPEPIDATRTLLRFNLADLGWRPEEWERLADRYPYAVMTGTAAARELSAAMKCALPSVRGDWLVAKASVSPLYEQLLRLPTTPAELAAFEFDRLGVEVNANLMNERAKRAGVEVSDVVAGHRVIERHPARFGAYWITYDLKATRAAGREGAAEVRRSMFQAPLGPATLACFNGTRRDLCFEPASSQRIFSLPNGLQGYLIVDGAGARMLAEPAGNLQDSSGKARGSVNGMGCIACHDQGIHPARDALRDHVLSSSAFSREVKETIAALHPSRSEFDRLIEADRRRFVGALEQAEVSTRGPEPIQALATRFEQRLEARAVAAELGLDLPEFDERVDRRALESLTQLRETLRREPIARAQFVSLFESFVTGLELGQYRAAGSRGGGATAANNGTASEGAPSGDAPTVIDGFTYIGRNDQGKHEYRHDRSSLVFVYLEGGSYTQGSPGNEPGRGDDEGPARQVTVSPFLIAKLEVTQEVYERFMRANPSGFPGDGRRPVETVSFDDALRFCELAGLAPAGRGELGIPTEAQWEFACRAGTTGLLSGKLDDVAWYDQNSDRRTHRVGTKEPNAFGIYDMHGNVWEWCRDYYSEHYSSGPVIDPTGPAAGTGRVYRGGSWGSSPSGCRSAYRFWFVPSSSFNLLGFRPAKSLK